MDANSSALNAWEHDNAKSYQDREDLEAAHPLSSFRDQAIANLWAEGGYELACALNDPDKGLGAPILITLIHATGCGFIDTTNVDLEEAQRRVSQAILDWLETEQERLHEEDIDRGMNP